MFRERDPFYAEMLLKQLGVYVSGEGTFEAGIGAVEDFSRRIGMDPDLPRWMGRDCPG